MHLFSADVEITAPLFIKAANLEDFLRRSKAIHGFGVHLGQNGLFSDRGFDDSKLRSISFATAFTVIGLWPGRQPFDYGHTTPPKSADDEEPCEGTDFRLFGTTARIAATIYIKAEAIASARGILAGLIGKSFKFEATDDQFFDVPPIHEDGVHEISFGTDFMLHRALEELDDRGPCPKWRFEERRLLASSIQNPKLVPLPFAVENSATNALSDACSPRDIRRHLKDSDEWFKARPIFRGKDFAVSFTNKSGSIDIFKNEPFPIPDDMAAYLTELKGTYPKLRDTDVVRLDCRYIEIPGLAPWLDIYHLSISRNGEVGYREQPEMRIGEPIECLPFPLDEETSDPMADFMAETRRVMDKMAAENLAFVDEVEAVLWFPTGTKSSESYQTVLVGVEEARTC